MQQHIGQVTDERLDLMDRVLHLVRVEVLKAITKHRPLNSPHEGYAVLQEEVDELWDEVKHDTGRGRNAGTEAIQCAAMGVRYVMDLVFLEEMMEEHCNLPEPGLYQPGGVVTDSI